MYPCRLGKAVHEIHRLKSMKDETSSYKSL